MYIELKRAEDDTSIGALSPIGFELDTGDSGEKRVYLDINYPYYLSDVTVSFDGPTSEHWEITSDVDGMPDNLNWGSEFNTSYVSNRVYFWVRRTADVTEGEGLNTSVSLIISGTIGGVYID